jgi:hypothetical protein
MEALIVAIFALFVIVFIEASLQMAITLLRWAPALASGVVSGWLADQSGATVFGALFIGALASATTRHFLRHALSALRARIPL